MSYLLGIIKDNIWDIIKTEKDSHQEVVKKFKNFIKKNIYIFRFNNNKKQE